MQPTFLALGTHAANLDFLVMSTQAHGLQHPLLPLLFDQHYEPDHGHIVLHQLPHAIDPT
jgi:hypothetical protein